jgi:hypothetical protein
LINQEFCCREWPDKLYINREEDMGVASLRQAKESYYPHHMLEKFSLTVTDNCLFGLVECQLKTGSENK